MSHRCARIACALASVVCAVCAVGCTFNDAAPADAVLACDRDNQCPAGQQCNVVRLRCVTAGSDILPPVVTGVTFEPAFVNGGVAHLVIEADDDLAADVEPLIAPAAGSAQLPFLRAVIDGKRADLAVDTDALDEGVYAVARVEVQDRAHNAGAVDVVNTSLAVDRTAPDILNPGVAVPAGGLSDIAGHDALTVSFLVTEPLATATLAVAGGAGSACDVDAALLRVTCTAHVDATTPDGDVTLGITAVDRAGNRVARTLHVDVDTAAPSIVADSVLVDVRGENGLAALALTAGGSVSLSFVVSEPLSAAVADAPVLDVVDDGGAVVLSLSTTVSGTRITAQASVTTAVAPGIYRVRARLTDVVGHVVDDVVPLPAPFTAGLTFGAAVVSSCPPPTGAVCVDADGDGFFAVNGCPTGDDCDDLDATVFPNAPELPGDGFDNGCRGTRDAPIDEDHGIFVDCSHAVQGVGSRVDPLSALPVDDAVIDAAHRTIFLRRDAACAFPFTLHDIVMIGGLSSDWARVAGAETRVSSGDSNLVIHGPSAFDSVRLDTDSIHSVVIEDRALVVRGTMRQQFFVRGDALVVDSTFDNVFIAPSGNGAFIHTDIAGAGANGAVEVQGRVFIHRSHVGWLNVSGSAVVTSSAIVAAVERDIDVVKCASCLGITLAHTTVVRLVPETVPLVAVSAPQGDVRFFASSFVDRSSAETINISAVDVSLVHVLVSSFARRNPATPVPPFAAVNGSGIPDLNSLDSSSLVDIQNSVEVTPVLFDDDIHENAQSPLRDSGRVTTALPNDVPTSAMIDIDGECRYGDGNPDIGADELP